MGGKPCAANILRRFSSNNNFTNIYKRFGGNYLGDKHVLSLSTVAAGQNEVKVKRIYSFSGALNFTSQIKFYSKGVKENAKTMIKFYEFSEIENKNKRTFLGMASLYKEKFKTRKGVVDFILIALKHMEEFGVSKDLESYKALADLMPKGPYVPQNRIQVEMVHFPREQDCMLDLLCQMEREGVIPDVEMGTIVSGIFGPIGIPTRKYYRMMYWMSKFKNRNPWPVPFQLPQDTFSIAKLAIEKITSVDLQTKITVFRTEDVEESIDKTWIISAQSPIQNQLLKKHDRDKPLIVEGGDHVWIRNQRVNYFILKSEYVPYVDAPPEDKNDISDLDIRFLNLNYKEKEEQNVHKQEDGIIYAVCATGTSEKDSLLSWIRLLQLNGNPIIGDLAVLFRFSKPSHQVVPFSKAVDTRREAKQSA